MHKITFVILFQSITIAASGWDYLGNQRRMPGHEHRCLSRPRNCIPHNHHYHNGSNHCLPPPQTNYHNNCSQPIRKCDHQHLHGSLLPNLFGTELGNNQMCQQNGRPVSDACYGYEPAYGNYYDYKPVYTTRFLLTSPQTHPEKRFPCRYLNSSTMPTQNYPNHYVRQVTPSDTYINRNLNFSYEIYEVVVKQILKSRYCVEYDAFAQLFVKFTYENFAYDLNELLIFTAVSLHNTSGFKYLDNVNDVCNGKYRSRGILMITTKPNYELLASASNDSSYFTKPEKLAGRYEWNIVASIKFWYCFLANTSRDYDSIIAKLAPQDAEINASCNEILNKRKCARRELYEQLYSLLSNY